MPQKPHGVATLPSGKKIKVGPDAVRHTEAKDTMMNLIEKLTKAAKEGIFPSPESKIQPY